MEKEAEKRPVSHTHTQNAVHRMPDRNAHFYAIPWQEGEAEEIYTA